jgi:hypothetical protein
MIATEFARFKAAPPSPGTLKTDPYLGAARRSIPSRWRPQPPFKRSDGGAHPDANQSDLPRLRRGGPVLSAHHQGAIPQNAGRPGRPLSGPRPGPPLAWLTTPYWAAALAFLLAGFVLRKGRKLGALPTPHE